MYLPFIVFFFEIILGQENVVVQTKNGRIFGRVATTVDRNKTYYAYQGIPYGQPPVGDLRFKSPIPAKKWMEILNATQEKPKCLQLFLDGSEDCLYINVFSPVHTVPSKLLPVMVWIFGGYFLYGEGSPKKFGPDYFLEENVIVVMFNYRVGIFGFLNTEDSASPGNYGLKDQILALKWVKQNIRNFGGNPKSITVFGESAGSASISYLVESPLTKHLFHRAIMESGTALNFFAYSRHPKEVVMLTALSLAIFTNDTQKIVDELRKCDTNILQLISMTKNIELSLINSIRNGIYFAPSAETDSPERVVTGKSYELLKNGHFNRVPLIIGFNSQESNQFMEALEIGRLYLARYDIQPADIFPLDLNIQNKDTKKYLSEKIKQHYFGTTPIVFTDEKNLAQYVTDDQFVRGITETVKLASKYTDVYFYRFSYDSFYPLDSDVTVNRPGVGHEEEVHYIFYSQNKRIPTHSDSLTRKRLVRLWSNFAKTGNPTPTTEPLLQNSKWIKASPTNLTYFDIGDNLSMKTDLTNYSIPWWFELYSQYGGRPL